MNEMAFELVVVRTTGPREILTVQAQRLLVGSGAHCDVRITDDGAGREHVLLELVGDGIVATAKHFAPRPAFEGRPFTQRQIGKSGELIVASTRLYVRAVPVVEKKGAVRARLLSAVALSIAAVVVPAFVVLALRTPDDPALAPPPKKHAALFEGASPECRVTGEQAAAAGAQRLALAGLQRERHPFDVTQGVAAVASYELSAACFRRAGMDAQATSAQRAGEALKARIEADYRVHRVRLEHALDGEDHRTSLREVKVLRKLTSERTGEYVDWLGTAERYVERRLRAMKKER